MVLALDTLPRKLLLALLAAAATAGLSIPLWSHYQVSRLSAEGTRENLERAIALQPGNPELHNRLGRVLLYSPLGDGGAARAALERAVQLGPHTASYWTDLALARELAGDLAGAAQALDRALAAEPRTPAVLWQRVNFALRRGENAQAQQWLRELLQLAPEYTDRALPLFSRVMEPATLLTEVVPNRVDAVVAAMDFIRREEHMAAAGVAWQRLMALQEEPRSNAVRVYLDWLIVRGEARLAQTVWQQAAQRGWIPVEAAAAGESFYNANFQYPLQNFGFDWRVTPHNEASVWMEARGPEPGMQSLCVQFTEGARADYAHVFHYVPVEPNSYYNLRATMRSDRLFSRAGAFLEVFDFGSKQVTRSDSVTGTSAWKNVAMPIATGAETRLLRVALRRPAPGSGEEPAIGLTCMAGLKWESLGAGQSADTGAPQK